VATLEELDNWGTMDAIDSFGNLEQLDSLTLQQPTAAVSLSASASGAVRRILAFAAAVTGAASVAAYASFIARFTAAVSVAATTSAAVLRIRPFDASAAVSGAASGVAFSIRGMLSSVSAAVTAASGNAVTFVNSGAAALAVTTSTLAHRLGDRWSVVPSENETWRNILAFPATLEDLDELGPMDNLDTYGSLEELDDLSEIIPNLAWTEVSTGTERWAVK
jgi:hypothetical protein